MSPARRLPLAWVLPRVDEPGEALARRTKLLLNVLLAMSNVVGAAVVFVLLVWVLPAQGLDNEGEVRIANLIAFVVFLGVAIPVGSIWGSRKLAPLRAWLSEDRPPTDEERLGVLRAPYSIVVVHACLWLLGVIVFSVLNLTFDGELGQRVAITVALGGVTTCAIAYLTTERVLRPAAARALASGVPEKPVRPGVRGRSLLAWTLGTGVPVLGLMLVALSTLTEGDFDADELAVAVLALGGIAVLAGIYVTMLAARAVADPISSVREALRKVERGDLDVEVPVYDGTQVGLLQAGFNRMVEGMRERERIQDLFGRHVGEEVAHKALEGGVELGGETRDVAILFADIAGSTEIAAKRPPHEVVTLLNRFFAIVVEAVREHGGWVNKFEGDAALAVFGAPVPIDDPAGSALAAARELARRLDRELDELEAGIGVSAGEVVAGNIGEEQRFEYTVIGDPVNEAARLTELAKSRDGRVLASERAVESASEEETRRWELGDTVELRGRDSATRLATPGAGTGARA